jgi:hypothetical protein
MINASGQHQGQDLNNLSVEEWGRASDTAIARSLLNRPVNPLLFKWVAKNKPYLA